MPTLLTQRELKLMNYRELQKICKDWGLRANLKSDEMIGLLLEAQSQDTQRPTPTPAPPVQPRSVPARLLTTKAGSTRLSSVAIHDVPKEINGREVHTATAARLETAAPVPPPPARSKKAKELQKRLGVGRPVAVGGTGARAVTRPVAFSRRGIRRSRSGQVEATIPEESKSPCTSDVQQTAAVSSSQAQSSSFQGEATQEKAETIRSPDIERLLSEFVSHLVPSRLLTVTTQVKPLQDQIDTLRAEVKRLQALETEVKNLNAIVKQRDSGQTVDEAQVWEATFCTRTDYLVEPSTPPTTSNVRLPSPKMVMSTGYAPTLLGKRQPESSISESLNAQEEDPGRIFADTSSPVKKRPKLSREGSSNKGKEVDRAEVSGDNTSTMLPRATGFVVYNDPQEGEFLPPANHLSDTSRSNGPRGVRQGYSTSSMSALENRNPFNYSLLPEPLAPSPTLFAPAFPSLEPPQSPTPAGLSLLGSLSTKDDRLDMFKTFGVPPSDRARRFPSGSSNDVTDPTALLHPPQRRLPSVDESRSTFGLMPSASGSDPKSEKPFVALKTTMYGTELEGDTRFGDFGVGGVAMGYWSGGRF